MKLSFVIPAYNEENYLRPCLEAIINNLKGKNYDVEIIVVNNASIDRTREVALSFSGVKVVDEPQKGLVRARQAGFLASTGDIIANLDADTRMPAGWLEIVFAEFNQDPNLVGLSGPQQFYDLPWIFNISGYPFYIIGRLAAQLTQWLWDNGAMMQGGNFVVRRSALEKVGGFDTRIDFYGEDTDIACRMAKAGKVKFNLRLWMWASGRRFKKEGYLRLTTKYSINYFWTIFFGQPFTKVSKDHR